MNTASNPFRLIIVNDSQEEAQRLASMFQNAGKPCRAQHIDKQAVFDQAIAEQTWDLVVVYQDATDFPAAEVIRSIRRAHVDLPMILLLEEKGERDVIDGMKSGACDVVRLDDDQHLLQVVTRELAYAETRKKTRIIERKLKEVSRRNQQLLDSSKDGIAFIQDGLFIYVNDSFAEVFGSLSRDDLEAMPLMDIVVEKDQKNLKHTLKEFPVNYDPQQQYNANFEVVLADGNTKSIDVELKLTDYDEESCIQLLINANVSDVEAINEIRNQDATTGFYTKNYFIDVLTSQIDRAVNDSSSYALLYIDIDGYEANVESQVGVEGGETLMAEVAMIMADQSQEKDIMARMGDGNFAIVSEETNIEKLLTAGNILCDLIANNLFQIKDRTLQLTASVGITLINETSIDAQGVIDQAVSAINVLRKRDDGQKGNGANIYQKEESEQPVLVGTIQKALSDNAFKLLFQPIISLRGEAQETYEVLVRLVDEVGEELLPDTFLQAAIDMGVAGKIDRWVVLESIKHLANNYAGQENTPTLVVNISHITLCDSSFLPWLKVALNAAKVSPSAIFFEAKETEVTQHLLLAKQFIEQSASMGINFSISHFGCSIDPIGLFQHIDIQYVKIDGSFSQEVQENPENAEAIDHLLKTLQGLSKVVTVPFVENANILSRLWKLGAHYIQGYYLQPPSEAMDYDFSSDES